MKFLYFCEFVLYLLYLCDIENITMFISLYLGDYFIICSVKKAKETHTEFSIS